MPFYQCRPRAIVTVEQDTDEYTGLPEDLERGRGDPGGSRAKGYSADPRPERPVPEDGPIPLVPDVEVRGHVRKPDQSGAVKPAGPADYTPNDRLMGSDR